LTELIRTSLDKNEFAAGVFIDLQKAFDTVDHNILLQKLHHYGIRGKAYDILKSYLCGRAPCTKVNNIESSYISVNHGVPQGSVLGPLLFILCINDLHNSIKNSKTIHFADDTTIICQEKLLKKLNKKINHDLALLVQWLRANKISLNTSKTVIVLFKNKCKPVTKKMNFRLSGQVLEPSSSAKYLGITIDKNLLWDHEIHNLAAKLSRSVGFLSKLRHFLDYKTLISIYYALFDSHIIYRLQCFGYINQTSFEKIDKLQKKALKIIHFKSITESTRPLFINSRYYLYANNYN